MLQFGIFTGTSHASSVQFIYYWFYQCATYIMIHLFDSVTMDYITLYGKINEKIAFKNTLLFQLLYF